MNRKYPQTFVLLLLTILIQSFAPPIQAQVRTPKISSQEIANRIERLRQIIPEKPMILPVENDFEATRILQKAAETKSLDALPLLIRAMGYNQDHLTYNAIAGQANFVVTIPYLRSYYADNAGEALFREAISTDKKWLPERIALAVKTILSEETQTKLKEQFKDEMKTTQNGIIFSQALDNEHLTVKLACHGSGFVEIFCTLDDKGSFKELYDEKNQ